MSKCDCYYEQQKLVPVYFESTGKYAKSVTETVGVCWGTKNKEECTCYGDESKCNFYKEKRKTSQQKARNNEQAKIIEKLQDEIAELNTIVEQNEKTLDEVLRENKELRQQLEKKTQLLDRDEKYLTDIETYMDMGSGKYAYMQIKKWRGTEEQHE